jgi:hypothetical protein
MNVVDGQGKGDWKENNRGPAGHLKQSSFAAKLF